MTKSFERAAKEGRIFEWYLEELQKSGGSFTPVKIEPTPHRHKGWPPLVIPAPRPITSRKYVWLEGSLRRVPAKDRTISGRQRRITAHLARMAERKAAA
jgi:hypothetical protein